MRTLDLFLLFVQEHPKYYAIAAAFLAPLPIAKPIPKDATMSFHSGRFDMYFHVWRSQSRIVSGLVLACSLVLSFACSKSFAPAASATPASTRNMAQGDPQPLNFDACTIFSAADAAQILGVPVRPVTNVGSCSYEAAKATSGGWHRNVALNVSKYKSASDENSAWDDQKTLRSLRPGRRNLTVLSGIGSEAYLQISPDRGSFDGEVWVHKNLSHFRLIEVSEQPPSPDVLKTMAQKIAAKLP
jgi:hypothetical protein